MQHDFTFKSGSESCVSRPSPQNIAHEIGFAISSLGHSPFIADASGRAVHHFGYIGLLFAACWLIGSPAGDRYCQIDTDIPNGRIVQPMGCIVRISALPADPRLLDPKKLLTPFDAQFDWKSLPESPQLNNVEDFIREKRGN